MENHPDLIEARTLIGLATVRLGTLHVGPLDYNVTAAADHLRTAAALIERFGQERPIKAAE